MGRKLGDKPGEPPLTDSGIALLIAAVLVIGLMAAVFTFH